MDKTVEEVQDVYFTLHEKSPEMADRILYIWSAEESTAAAAI